MATACPTCGATNPDAGLVCSLCHRHFEPESGIADQEQSAGPNGFLPAPPRTTGRVDEREFSRVKAGTTSFGLRGRLVISAICLAPCLFMWFMVGGIGARTPTDIAVTMLPVFPGLILPFFFLRNAWRSHRIK